jgi:hypothetical protein
MNEHLDRYLRREFPEYAVTIERTTEIWGDDTLKVQSTEMAILLLGEAGITDEGAEHLYDFLDSASGRLCHEGTPVKLLSGYTSVQQYAFVLPTTGDTIRMVPSLLGCMRRPRQSFGEDIFDLRTTLLLDKSNRPSNEQQMTELRTKIRKESAKAARKKRKAS